MGYIREMTIDAPLDLVWRAWTRPTDLRSWLAPDCEVGVGVGGPWEFAWANGDATKGCHLLGFEPLRRLEFEWTAGGADYHDLFEHPHASTRVEVRLSRKGDATVVTVEQREWREGADWAAYEEIVADDWEEALVKLKSHCEG